MCYWRTEFWLGLVGTAFWWTLAGLSLRNGIPWLRIVPAAIFTIMLIVSGVRLWHLSGVEDPARPVARRLGVWIR